MSSFPNQSCHVGDPIAGTVNGVFEAVDDLVELGDPDELLREIDRLVEARNWAALVHLCWAARAATSRGKQLWGPAGYGEYQLALDGPAADAAATLLQDRSPLAIGPTTEVLVARRFFAELDEHLVDAHTRAAVAQEAVVRGENLVDELASQDVAVIEDESGLPLQLCEWEPDYSIAHYRNDGAEFPAPTLIAAPDQLCDGDAGVVDKVALDDALRALVEPWRSQSNGVIKIAYGSNAIDAAEQLDVVPPLSAVTTASALGLMAWVGASGGHYGRRRGAAFGRRAVWSVLAALRSSSHAWPFDQAEVHKAAESVSFFTWARVGETSYELCLSAQVGKQPALGFAVHAYDVAEQ